MQRKLMHVGPSFTSYRVQMAGIGENIGFASPEFLEAMKYSLEGLLRVAGADDAYLPFILPGSGTVAMETVSSILPKGTRTLLLTNGVFGDRWIPIMSSHGLDLDVLSAEPGKAVTVDDMEKKLETGKYQNLIMTHVETSTGVRMDLEKIVPVARRYVERIIVDGVASLGAEKEDVKKLGITAVISASQKALGAPPGAALMVVSRSALDSINEFSYFFNLKNWIAPMERYLEGKNGYLSTEPVGVILSLSKVFSDIDAMGLDARIEEHRRLTMALNEGIEAAGLRVLADRQLWSNTVTAVLSDHADDIVKRSMELGVEFATGVHPKLIGKYFRVGHMGYINDFDALTALSVIERSASYCGERVKIGEGVRRAQQVLFEMTDRN
ncbi:alanine--glyoxylate aminotransferase family protein [Thermoplasma sp. Kam2015]|uniref:aminotransferase class V-fold PLP-dependent enzyme n=1 Tax=Thermoplasma sp. Kam2015 TaxID=2094122 RepID=UPI000DA01C96|nr:alanine--glyoxylate aminotransferase family protein [Thermoplasma sp. Kam2015]PYB68075.1 alanine--glyoxylate aminotransferase family protein [Thermoplasma sp. Kam2015]